MLFRFHATAFHAPAFLLLLICCAAITRGQINIQSVEADPPKLFEQAQDAHARGDLQAALALYEQALKLRPEFPEAEYQRGAALVSLKRLPEAEKAFRRAIELRDSWPLPLAALGALLARMNRFDEAEPLLHRALELNASNAVALSALTELRLRKKSSPDELTSLLKRLRAATEESKDSREAASLWTARASLELSLNDPTAALASFDHALALDSSNATARMQRANLRADAGDITGAIEDARTAQANAQFSAAASLSLNRIYTLALSDAKGRAALENLLARETRDALLLARLGESYRTSDAARALQYYARAVELEPRNVDYATGYAAALVQARRFAEARDILRRVISVAPDNYAARANLATALYELKNYADALPEYLWIARAKPNLAATYFFIGIAHDNLGEFPEALVAYENFLTRADAQINQLEIDKVNLRLPALRNQIKQGAGTKKHKAQG